MAHDFFVPATSGGEKPSPPFPKTSLTEYFYQQSNQSFTFYGEPYPEVIVTKFDESHYKIRAVDSQSLNGMAELTKEVLDYIDAQGFEFDKYDANHDGYVDHIFIIPRKFVNRPDWSGFSVLGNSSLAPLSYDSTSVDWNLSGSYNRYGDSQNIIPLLRLGRLMAHEFGHDIWGAGHLNSIFSNDVPSNGTLRLGYTLMADGNNDMAGAATISAFERDLIGWIDCVPLEHDESYVQLDHIYSSGDCRTIALGNGSSGRTIYLSNLQRDAYFDELHIYDPPCFYAEDGLKTTGLLVGLNQGIAYDEIPADNTIDRSIIAAIYDGDLYSPTTSKQITPWTRPNINGFTVYPSGFTPSWDAVDNIRYTGLPNRQMEFDYIKDFRTNPVIRSDSWIGAETDNYTFQTDLVVEAGATLTISPGTTLKFAPGKRIKVYGNLKADSVTFTASGASSLHTIAYDGLLTRGEHRIRINGAQLPPGVYLLRASSIDWHTARRMIRR